MSYIPLKAENVTRSFGDVRILDGVNITVQKGEISALLGPNGAGKTTLSKICGGLLLADSGKIEVGGTDISNNPKKARTKVALVTGGDRGFYGRVSARDNLLFFADLAGVPSAERKKRVDEALLRVQLDGAQHKKTQEYSRGMLQRLHLARGIITHAPLLILDEITSGLDPEISFEIRTLIREIANEGVGILFTSHLLGEVEKIADTISLLQDGRIVVHGSAQDIVKSSGAAFVTIMNISHKDHPIVHFLQEKGALDIRFESIYTGYQLLATWSERPSQEIQDYITNNTENAMTRPCSLEEAYLALLAHSGRK